MRLAPAVVCSQSGAATECSMQVGFWTLLLSCVAALFSNSVLAADIYIFVAFIIGVVFIIFARFVLCISHPTSSSSDTEVSLFDFVAFFLRICRRFCCVFLTVLSYLLFNGFRR